MGATIEFRRRWAQSKQHPRRKIPAPLAPWVPFAVVMAVVAGLYAWSKLHPASVTVTGIGNNVTFRLCGRGVQRNCVIDGDTIRYDGQIIRLADIDAPETAEPKCASEAALGRQATQRLLTLMNSGPFTIVREGPRDQDQYGRSLRTIQRNGRSIADTMIAEGLVRRWDGSKHSWCG
ncbi:MAG TPA: thermonuclease family protein [Xanthobacteraceae bacterium]|nr:thermonuclease family protein [Xanthobacteraceae bacterium]